MRTKAEGIGVPKSARPQVWEEPTLPIYRRYAKLRTQLYPYLKAADRIYAKRGMPIMRQLALAYPHDPHASGRDAEYLFGPDLLVAPVLEPGATSRSVYLPHGDWIDFWDAVAFREGSGDFRIAKRAGVTPGAGKVKAEAPLEEIPVFARRDAAPAAPGRRRDARRLRGRRSCRSRRSPRPAPRARLPTRRSSARFGGAGRLRSAETDKGWRLRVSADRKLRIDLEASMTTLRRPFRPRRVEVDAASCPAAAGATTATRAHSASR